MELQIVVFICFHEHLIISTYIKDHLKLNKCESDFKDFSVIGCESNRSLRELKESLFINQLKPNLNKQVKSAKLFLF